MSWSSFTSLLSAQSLSSSIASGQHGSNWFSRVLLISIFFICLYVIQQIYHVSKDCSFARKHFLCWSTTSVFTILVLLAMRSVNLLLCISIVFCTYFKINLKLLDSSIHVTVRSSCSEPWWACIICWWFSWSDCWGSWLFWVIMLY